MRTLERFTEQRLRQLHVAEQKITERSYVSATTFKAASRDILSLPQDVSGLTILDLAAGASDITAELLARGVNAHALDCSYYDFQELLASFEVAVPMILRQTPPVHRRHMKKVTVRAFLRFRDSFFTHNSHYHPGWLTNLPFPDNFADRTFSINGISHLAERRELFRKALEEAVRVTRPGGLTIIAPFHTRDSLHKQYARIHNKVARELKRSNGVERIEIIPPQPDGYYKNAVLRIFKKAG